MAKRFTICALLFAFALVSLLQLAASKDYADTYDWTGVIKTGDDLKVALTNVDDKIIVTLWMENIYGEWEQNKKNEVVRGSLKSLISAHHPKAIYAEADVSDYNVEAYTFEKEARAWGIDLKQLRYGPIIVPMYQNHGQMFYGSDRTTSETLLQSVQDYLGKTEKETWPNDRQDNVNVELILDENNEYVKYNPWQPYDHFYPGKAEAPKAIAPRAIAPQKKKVTTNLKQPEKAFEQRGKTRSY